MTFNVNNKEYTIEENINLYDFLISNNIYLPILNDEKLSTELCFIEKVGCDEILKATEIYVNDNESFFTNSKKVYNYLNKYVSDNNNDLKLKFDNKIKLDEQYYNILLCDPENYDYCLNMYSDKGFNDIINIKFAQMILFIEITHQLLSKAIKKMDNFAKNPFIVVFQNIINYPKKYRINLKPIEEIAAEVIKEYYKKNLKIEKPIRIIYATKSLVCLLNYKLKIKEYISLIDDIVILDNLNITTTNKACFDELISKKIYIKNNEYFNKSCNYNSIFKNLQQMGFVEESLDILSTDNGRNLIVKYKTLELNFLFTYEYLTFEEIKNLPYDFIMMTTKKETSIPNAEEGLLTDYNINQIYKKYIIYPGNMSMFRRV